MAAAAISKNRKIAISQQPIRPIAETFGTETHIDPFEQVDR